jgi:hypothetical protein
MKFSVVLIAALAAAGLSGCDRPSVVEVPGPTVVAPSPAAPPSTTVVEVPRHEEHPVIVDRPEERRSDSVTVDHGDRSVTVTKSQDSH